MDKTPSSLVANFVIAAAQKPLLKIAAKKAPIITKVAAKAALKAAGLKQTLCDDLLKVDAAIESLRREKRNRINDQLLRHRRRGFWSHTPFREAKLPNTTLLQRLDWIRIFVVRDRLQGHLRIGVNDDITVKLTGDPQSVNVVQTAKQSWDKYNIALGSFKKWPCNFKLWTVTVPTDWRIRVERKGLAVVDGLMTLDAAPMESSGCEVFAATWMVQSRGTAVSVERGYIARHGKLAYHAKTADRAISGLARKSKALAFTAALNHADLSDLVAQCAGSLVSIGDARFIGACTYGIKSWCNAVGLAYQEGPGDELSGSAPIEAVYAAYEREPRAEARAAILHAVRRNRSKLQIYHDLTNRRAC